jgi:uncharacterized membrane protein
MKDFLSNLVETLKPFRFRIIGLLAGLIIAILFLTLGFWKTILLVLLSAAGFIVGFFLDDRVDLGDIIDRIMSRVKGDN